MVVIDAENIRGAIFSVDPAAAGIQSLRTSAARERRKGIHKGGVATCPVQAEVDVILIAPAPSSSANWPQEHGAATAPEIVHQAKDHRV